MEVVVTGRHCEMLDQVPAVTSRTSSPDSEARPPDHPGECGGRNEREPAPARPSRTAPELTASLQGAR